MLESIKEHRVIGMERIENIHKNFTLKDSILFIINNFIKSEESISYVDIDMINNELIFKILSNSSEMTLEIDEDIDIHKNKFLLALAYLSKKCKIEITMNNSKIISELSFERVNSGNVTEKIKSMSKGENLANSILINFSIDNLNSEVIDLTKRSILLSIKSWIEIYYRELIKNGVIFKIFDSIAELRVIDGNWLNCDNYLINGETEIKIYKLKSDKRNFEIIINNVIIPNEFIAYSINWNKEPFKIKGYSFKRIQISLFLKRVGLDLNNFEEINEKVELYINEIKDMVKVYQEEFLSDVVHINLVYDKKDMKEIMLDINKDSASQATKEVLDLYKKSIKKII